MTDVLAGSVRCVGAFCCCYHHGPGDQVARVADPAAYWHGLVARERLGQPALPQDENRATLSAISACPSGGGFDQQSVLELLSAHVRCMDESLRMHIGPSPAIIIARRATSCLFQICLFPAVGSDDVELGRGSRW